MKVKTTGTYALLAIGAVLTAAVCLSHAAAVESVYPLERARRILSDKAWSRVVGLFRGAEASAENVRLRREVAALALARDDVARLEAENARLRDALGYAARAPGEWLVAAVLAGEGGAVSAHNMLRVGKGSLAGVRKGAVVVVPEGLVGRVESVTPHTSEIRLVTDPSLKVGCEVALPGGDFLRGTLAGGTDERLVLRHILSPAEVPPRSPVYTSGRGGIYPKGIAVGTLLEVRRDHDAPRREGEVMPAVDFSTLRDVFIRRET